MYLLNSITDDLNNQTIKDHSNLFEFEWFLYWHLLKTFYRVLTKTFHKLIKYTSANNPRALLSSHHIS